MNTYELQSVLGDYVKRFDGVFSIDRLPTKPRLLVCNTDPSTMPGEHWIAIYVDDDGHYGEYFDSLGRAHTQQFEHYMNEHCREWSYNCKQLQSITGRFCGPYCACCCIIRSRGVSMADFVCYFNRHTGLNDVIVHELMCSNVALFVDESEINEYKSCFSCAHTQHW